MVTFQTGNVSSPLSLLTNGGANPNSTLSSQEFTKALSDAIAGTLERFGIDPSNVTVDLGSKAAPSTSQNIAPSQVSGLVASTTPASTPTPLGFNALIPKDNTAQPAAPAVTAAPIQHWYAASAVDDAYWNKQPAVVQQLREIDDYGQRQALGTKLASQGYQIDVPIMIWGWDAGTTTDLRKSFGYTWVPSASQPSVSAAPGLQGGGIVPYDPTKPPPGSIQV